MLLMVMEMRMSDWTDFVGVISERERERERERESKLLWFYCLSDVLLLLTFFSSSSRYHGLICSL